MDDQYLYGLSFLVVLANNADGNSYYNTALN